MSLSPAELQHRFCFVHLTVHWSSVFSRLPITDQAHSQQCQLFGNRFTLVSRLPEELQDLQQLLAGPAPSSLLLHSGNNIIPVEMVETFP